MKLGRTDLYVSRLGYGCSRVASLTSTQPLSEVRSALLKAFEEGINFFDTADVYGQGDSERLLGNLFNKCREQVVFCSKAGLIVGTTPSLIRWLKPIARPVFRRWEGALHKAIKVRREGERKCFEPVYLMRQVDSSLQRLRTDYLDVFLLHNPPVEVIHNQEVLTLLEELRQSGKIRYYGISCDGSTQALAALSINSVSCIQVPVNLLQRDMIATVLPVAREKGVGIIAREPLAGGAVFHHRTMAKICHTHPACSPASIALRYTMEKVGAGVILTGMSSRRHLEENLKIAASASLPPEMVARLDDAVEERVELRE